MTLSLPQPDTQDVRFGAVSCPHCPNQNDDAVEELCELLPGLKLDVFVLLGDLFEADSASVHKHKFEERTDLLSEYAAAADFLRKIREAVGPECQLEWMLGNHDDNLQVNDFRRIPKHLRNLVHWNKSEYREEFQKWRQHPYEKSEKGLFTLGQVGFYHGYDVRAGSDEAECIQMCNLLGGHAHMLMIRGHTHAPVAPTQAMFTSRIPLPYWYANPGTLGPIKPDYMKRKDSSAWGSALIHGQARLGRPSRMRQGPQWEAYLHRLG